MKAKQVGSLLVAAAMLMTAATGCAAGDKVEKVLKIGSQISSLVVCSNG